MQTLIVEKKRDVPRASKKKGMPVINFNDFDAIRVSVASPDEIRSWSHGEVRKPETINYRTFKPERDGLFCERIFGPVRDWECSCGKYKYIKYKGVVCDRCGVEVTEARVRRERMGSIELAVPVGHVWYMRKAPSRIGSLLGIRLTDLEKIVYYARYVVLEDLKGEDGKVKFDSRQMLTDEEYHKARSEYGDKLKAGIGADAIRQMLETINLDKEVKEIRERFKKVESEAERNKLIKRLRILEGFLGANSRPEWMVLTILPVIPPDLRPLVPLEGGRFATSDLNDLYRRIINRNNRLKHIESLRAPEVMIHNEKRLLQEAVDALIENGARGKVVVGAGGRPLKSLSDILKGKQGRFRQNLLGKRVDYSGRSVIVVGPYLKLHQCGLPKEMALELFKPFIIRELMKRQNITLKAAKRMLERAKPEIWDILEQVTKDIPIMLNRAPTLHRLGVQAFMPVLIEGKSIQLHPLTCSAFNADFDGDQMAVHVPLSLEAQLEAKVLMIATNNILSPASGKPIAVPSQDMILGVAYMTKYKEGVPGEGRYFSGREEVVSAYQNQTISLHAKIKVAGVNILREEGVEDKDQKNPSLWKDWTTVGRILFNEVVPAGLGYININISKKEIANLVDRCYRELGSYQTAIFLDQVKKIGFIYATKAGLSISVSDFHIPTQKQEIVKRAQIQVKEIAKQAKMGVITDSERYNKIIDLWTHVTDEVSDHMFDQMQKQDAAPYKEKLKKFNSVFLMADSGARGSRQQIRQLGGMRGLMQKPQKKLTGAVGEIIENPVIANFREGLSVLEYFISTHGGRKGLADTALKTADAGYLTRRLIDVAHDIVVTEEDCETINGVSVGTLKSGEDIVETIEERILGRVGLDNIVDPLSDEVIVKVGEMISADQGKKLTKAGIDRLRIRSVLTCEAKIGCCAQCYGLNLATGRRVEIGEAVGIIAAQSIGEPGTQLTLRTFHIGGTASRVIQRSQILCKESGNVKYHGLKTLTNRDNQEICVSRNGFISIRETGGKERSHYEVRYGARIKVTDGKKVEKGDLLVEWDPYSLPILTEEEGTVKLEDVTEGVTLHEEKNRITGLIERVIIEHRVEALHPQIVIIGKSGKGIAKYPLPIDTNLVVQDGDKVKQGDILAKIPQEISKSKDITGGLPRVAELFEARKPKNPSTISEIEGTVKLAPTPKGGLKVIVTNEETGMERDYAVPQGKHLVVYEGDRVGVGEPLVDGAVNPHDILKVKGAKEVQEFLVNEIQEVYRLQGVIINDKHIEVIVRRMLSNVIITKSGGTDLLAGEIVPRTKFSLLNKSAKKGEQAEAQPVLLGITKASLASESFISAASFQETTRVLVEAATTGAVDQLKGLKENVIIGHLIPAGTGFYERDLIEKAEKKG